ncbi:MAG: aspartate ammonia-lyase [Bdellovibrio sp.]|nr:aspartate ammonia-lyase [Bdellovibrio sp.]
MATFREEHDSLGNVKVPADALYGAQTYRAVENYPISGRTAHPALIRAYLRIKSAAATANQACQVLDPKNAKLITDAVQEILSMSPQDWPKTFPVDPYQAGAGTSQNMNINEVVANVSNRHAGKPLGTYEPIHPNDHVNRSQSTNDSFPTAMRLAILETAGPLVKALNQLSSTLQKKADAWKMVPKSARTHLQDAVPMTLGQEFSAYAKTLGKCAKWIEDGRNELKELGIGGSAAGTGLTVPKGYTAAIVKELSRLTGEELRISDNLCEAMQSQSPVTYYSSMLRLTALELTRICNDLRLMASGPMTGLAEILLPAVQPGSSIMPGKVNPSIIEMANQTWYSVLGYDHTVANAGMSGQLELNVMMPIMAYSMLEATQVTTHACEVLTRRCIEGLEPNRARLTKYFESTPQIATALSPKLGYERTAKLVKESLEKGMSVVDLVREQKLIQEEELKLLLDTRTLTGL